MYGAMTIFIGKTESFDCPRCRGAVSVTMTEVGPVFASADEQSICPEITERYLTHGHGAQPVAKVALCEPLRREVALHHPS